MIRDFSWSDGELVRVFPGSAYPRLYKLADGRLICGFDGMRVSFSSDDGLTWSETVKASDFPELEGLACANAAITQLEDGEILLAYRALGGHRGGARDGYASLQVSSSKDGGATWTHHSTIYEHTGRGGVYEPHFEYIDGVLTVFYANDTEEVNILPYQFIEYKQWVNGEWTNRTVISDGGKHKSRDGMPVWCPLSSGGFVCAIEAWNTKGNGNMIVKLIWSEDGKVWSEPYDIYYAKKGKAAAPYVIELPDGRIMVSFQTDEDMTLGSGDNFSAMKTIISDGTPVKELKPENFSVPDMPFETPDGYHSIWNGLYRSGNFVYAVTSGNYPKGEGGILLRRYELKD